MRLFPNSWTRVAFKWYTNLPANSIHNWQEIEETFHGQFYKTKPEVSIADLSRLHQLSNEPIEDYIRCFRKLKFQCKVLIPEISEETFLFFLDLSCLAYELPRILRTKHDCPSNGLYTGPFNNIPCNTDNFSSTCRCHFLPSEYKCLMNSTTSLRHFSFYRVQSSFQ